MLLIEPKPPKNWKELQNNVTKILIENGLKAESPKKINTVRGSVEIDVFAVDYSMNPASVYLCECKFWGKKVKQGEVFKFRTIASDYGANWGLIISSKGFQPGSYEATKNSNIKLLDWNEFQNLFFEKWYLNYFCPELRKEAEPLIDYMEPFNSRIFKKADLLPLKAQQKIKTLRDKYAILAYFSLSLFAHLYGPIRSLDTNEIPNLPLSNEKRFENSFPEDILNAVSYRELLLNLIKHVRKGLSEFDAIFGGRA